MRSNLETEPYNFAKSMEIKTLTDAEIDPELASQIANIACRSFPSEKTVEQRIAELLTDRDTQSPQYKTGRRFMIFDAVGTLVAHARTFIREIKTADGVTIPVLALATVCTDPDSRGKGYGVQIIEKAFEQVGQPGSPSLSLFQTPVPPYYEKLNCRIVTNEFVDRTNLKSPETWPWRDDVVMIYPATAQWPEGVIDINGPDY